jgi:hypothetical protein
VIHIHFPRFDGIDGLHSPSGHCSHPDQSVQPFQPPEAHLAERPIALSNPLASCSANRSVNPGTESMMTETMFFVNPKQALFLGFPQLFRGLHFNDLQTRRGESDVHKPAPGDSVPICPAIWDARSGGRGVRNGIFLLWMRRSGYAG